MTCDKIILNTDRETANIGDKITITILTNPEGEYSTNIYLDGQMLTNCNTIPPTSSRNYGFSTCGSVTGITERFDDITNTHTTRANATARQYLAGYSFNNYGFSTCGSFYTGLTERFDDVTNTHTTRASASPREDLAGYSFNNYGFSTCGVELI